MYNTSLGGTANATGYRIKIKKKFNPVNQINQIEILKDKILKILLHRCTGETWQEGFLCEKDLGILVNDKSFLDYGVGYFIKKLTRL